MGNLSVDVTSMGRRAMVSVKGDVDGEVSDELAAVLDAVVASGVTEVDVEFAGVRFIDSTCVRALGRTAVGASHRGVALAVVAESARVRRVFDIVDFGRLGWRRCAAT